MTENQTASLLSEIVIKYHQFFLKISKNRFCDIEEAEDHLQNVYLEILSKSFDSYDVLKNYIITLIRNRFIDKQRKRKGTQIVELYDDNKSDLDIVNLPDAVSDSYNDEQLSTIFLRAGKLAKLTATEWDLYNLWREDKNDEEIRMILQKDNLYVARLKNKVKKKVSGIGVGLK